jgi:hypothetical protein
MKTVVTSYYIYFCFFSSTRVYFFIFLKKTSDRLQTEKFQLKKLTQQLAAFSKQQPMLGNMTIKQLSYEELPKIEDTEEEETEVK